MEIYDAAEGIEVTRKGDDSPLTKADLAAHDIIVAGLQAIDSTPIVSEEGRVGDPPSALGDGRFACFGVGTSTFSFVIMS